MVDVGLRRPDGSWRQARFWVDTGGGALILAEPLARDLGLTWEPPFTAEGSSLAPARPPAVRVGDAEVGTAGAETFVAVGSPTVQPGVSAVGLLPGHVLMRHRVVLNYPARRFGLLAPGGGPGAGHPVPLGLHPRSGFPRLCAEIDGERWGLLLDTGASFTMLSRALIERLDGPRVTGAAGGANMGLALDADTLLVRLRSLRLAGVTLDGVCAVSRPEGLFERRLSRLTTDRVVGALGGNVLRAYRVDIDYQAGTAYLAPGDRPPADELSLVPLVLRPDGAGWSVAGVVRRAGEPLARSVLAGDRLVAIGDRAVGGWTLAQVVAALRGSPGEARVLTLARQGEYVTVNVPVVRVL